MNDKSTTAKVSRQKRSLDDEIQLLRAKLKQKEDKKAKMQKEQQEANRKAILELIRSEKLDAVSFDSWKKAMPQIKALMTQSETRPQAAAKSD